jgi:hypothetical protein
MRRTAKQRGTKPQLFAVPAPPFVIKAFDISRLNDDCNPFSPDLDPGRRKA